MISLEISPAGRKNHLGKKSGIMNPRNQLILFAKILLSGIILAYLFYSIPVKEIINSILSTNLYFFAVGILSAVPINYLSAFETQYLTGIQGIKLSVTEILKIHLATSFYGLFLPGILSAGAVKWYKFSKFGKKSSAAAVVVINRLLEVLMVVFVGILFFFPALLSSGNHSILMVLTAVLIFMILFYLLLLSSGGLKFILKIVFMIPLNKRFRELLNKFAGALLQFRNLCLKDHFKIIGLLFLYHSLGIFSFYCFAKSLDITLSIWVIGWIRSAMSIAIMLPLSFAGFGIREGTLVLLFSRYGIKAEASMALSFLFFSKNLITSLLGGIFELKDFILSKKSSKEGMLNPIREN